MRDAYGLGAAVGLYGASFGAAAVTAGLSVPQACVLSLLMFTGASQFALVGVLGAGGTAVSAVAGALLLGARNTLYAVRMSSLLPERGPRRLVTAQLTIDESTAMAVAAPPALAGTAFWATGTTLYLLWNLMTLLGALGAARLGDPRALGLDALVPAAFLALLWPQLRDRSRIAVALAGALVALVAVPLTPPGVPVLLAGAVVLPLLVRR
ncbi:MAG: AzlC family ABC transporter permease [Mycobacteriales bacterium]